MSALNESSDGPPDLTSPEAPPAARKPAAVPVASVSDSLLRTYFASVATFGIYLAWRVGRLAAVFDVEGRQTRRKRVFWGLGVYFLPAACALLYEIPRLARKEASEHGAPLPRSPLWVAPALFATLYLIGHFGPFRALIAPLVLLLPLPFLLVQRELNRLEFVRSARVAVAPRSRRGWLLMAFLPVTGLILHRADFPEFRALADTQRLDEGTVVNDPEGQFTLVVPGEGWDRVRPDVLVDDGAEMGFRKPSTGAFLLTRSRSLAGKGGLDELVADRRQAVKTIGQLQTSQEKRIFLRGVEFVPLSLARYTVRQMGVNLVTTHVATMMLGGRGIEVIAISYDQSDDDTLANFVASVAAVSTEVEPSQSQSAAQ